MEFTVDLSEFNQAMSDYATATGKDSVTVINRCCRNLAGRSIQFTEKSNKAAISDLENQKWFWVMVYKRLGKGKTKAQAKALARKIIASKKRSAGFIASGWLTAFQEFKAATGSGAGRTAGVKAYGKAKGDAVLATEKGTVATGELTNSAGSTKSDTSAQALQTYGKAGLETALAYVIADINKYSDELMQKTARKYSAS